MRKKAEGSRTGQEFAVIGLGRFGSTLAQTLTERGFSVLGIDRDPEVVQRYADEISQTLALDATDEDALREIDITSFDTVVVAIGAHFEENVLTTVALKSVGVKSVISKAATRRQYEILLRVGADSVVQPEFDAARRLAQQLAKPGIVDQIVIGPVERVSQVIVPPPLWDKTLAEVDIEKRFNVRLLAWVRSEGVVVNPPGTQRLAEGDFVLVYGNRNDIARLMRG